MKVKVGDKTYDSEDVPVMVVLEGQDKERICSMPPDLHCYVSAPAGYFESEDMYREWMEEDE